MRRVVVKFGTRALMSKDGRLSGRIFDTVAGQIAEVYALGIGVAIVSSGAIQAGREAVSRMGLKPSFLDSFNKKDIAGIGSRHLMNKWGDSLNFYGLEVCETLVTYANWTDGNERKNIKEGILDCFGTPFIPIINENDRVSDEEIRLMEKGISENDRLARMVAILIEADAILFVTEVGGVYDKDPINNSKAKILKEVRCSHNLDFYGCSKEGTGGMAAKMKEAMICLREGVATVAVSGLTETVISDFIRGETCGTRICL